MSKPSTNIKEEQERPLNVLIIAHKHSQLASAAAFLSRRGVPCTVKGNIREGIQYIISQKVTFVFLSWNLPGANIIRTYQLLTQHFKTDCVAFAERPDGKTAAELNSSRLLETMQAPVSGPGLYMRIQKIFKARGEILKLDKFAKLRESNTPVPKDEDVNLNSAEEILSEETAKVHVPPPKYHTEELEAQTGVVPENDITSYLDQIEKDTTKTIIQEGMKRGELHQIKVENPIHLLKKSQSRTETTYGSVFNAYKKNETKNNIVHQEPTPPKESLILDFKPRAGFKDSESILAQKTYEAIEKSVRPAFADYSAVAVVSKAKIFNIHTPRFRGYLIFVVPMNHEFEKNVVISIRENLDNLLEEANERLLFFEEINIEIEQKNFLGWAQENAEFFVQTVDHKTEIICAFYPYENALPQLAETKDSSMSLIDIKDLKQNTKTNVNLYIHLPKNNKFVCYMKPGDIITETHIEKFEKHKVSNLHIKRDEITPFKEYFVSNQVQEIIRKKVS